MSIQPETRIGLHTLCKTYAVVNFFQMRDSMVQHAQKDTTSVMEIPALMVVHVFRATLQRNTHASALNVNL